MRSNKLGGTFLMLGLCLVACKSKGDSGNDGESGGSSAGGSGGTAGSTGNAASGGTEQGGSTATGGSTTTGGSDAGVSNTAGAGGAADAGASGSSTGGSSDAGNTAGGGTGGSDGGSSNVSFFITSTGSMTANLGGLAGADSKCATLAAAAGFGGKTWHAYLSVEHGPDNMPVNARDRIGAGPWYNVNGVLLAADLTALHALNGDYMLFLDEHGTPVPGQWTGSPTPVQHDILTGSNRDGTLKTGYTCGDWTSESADSTAWVGHTDGLGPPGNTTPDMYRPWNSVHENGGCNDTAPRGGNGRIACFAVTP